MYFFIILQCYSDLSTCIMCPFLNYLMQDLILREKYISTPANHKMALKTIKTNSSMNKILTIMACLLFSAMGMAQRVEYQTFIYTSDDLADEIARKSKELRSTRGYMGDLFDATLNAGRGIASGYVTSFIDLGVNAIGSLITSNARHKEEWLKTVNAENVYETQIRTVSEVNDFYKETSFDGAMDPKGMRFDGIGCLRKEGKDTVFYISCHIDRSKISRIINHSKFELVLDTLIVSPTHSNLPNSQPKRPYSFDERKNFTLSMNIKLTSSWMNEIVQLQKDQVLGEFSINIPVDPSILDKRGFLHYVRHEGTLSAYKVVGESFIVPRSYMGYRDEDDNYKNSWGTGEYKLNITLKETCDITDSYRENWKADRKQRKAAKPGKGFIATAWQTVSNQKWDEITQSWVITTLKAPAGIISKDVIDKLGLETSSSSTPQSAMQGKGNSQVSSSQGGSQGGASQGNPPAGNGQMPKKP